jgi:hypothetical protein
MSDKWICKKCGGINPGNRPTCLGCNSENSTGNNVVMPENRQSKKVVMAFPPCCARCGKYPVTKTWPIMSQYNIRPFIYFYTYKSTLFKIPICDDCFRKLSTENYRWYRLFIISCIPVIVFSCLYFASFYKSTLFLILSLVFIPIALVGAYKRYTFYYHSGIASYNGVEYKFTNKDYQRQFDELNNRRMI